MAHCNRALRAIFVPLTLSWLAVQTMPVRAQVPTPGPIMPFGISIEYKVPTNPKHTRIYERLKNRKVLEQYKEFMSPLKFRQPLHVSLQGCNGVISAHYMGDFSRRNFSITYCYELVSFLETMIADSKALPGFRREDALVGGFVSIMLHETGHAIYHMLDVPVFGREEDAADAIAAFVALQFGQKTARRILTGTAHIWRAWELTRQKRANRRFEDYSDEHGTDAQRFYNTLCIALGSDAVERNSTFADFAQLLPENRRGRCPNEYLQTKKSFLKLVLPHVDQALMQKVRATEWLRSDDGTDILPPQTGGPGPGPSGPGQPGPGQSGPNPSGPGKPGPGMPVPGKPK